MSLLDAAIGRTINAIELTLDELRIALDDGRVVRVAAFNLDGRVRLLPTTCADDIPAANERQAHNASGLTDAREGGCSATSATSAPGRSARETPG